MTAINFIEADDQSYAAYEWAILLFESPWCGSCKELLRYLEKFSLPEDIDCFRGKVDITQNQPMAMKYNVMSLPTVIIFQKGIEKERFSGAMSEGKFFQKIKKVIGYVT